MLYIVIEVEGQRAADICSCLRIGGMREREREREREGEREREREKERERKRERERERERCRERIESRLGAAPYWSGVKTTWYYSLRWKWDDGAARFKQRPTTIIYPPRCRCKTDTAS